MSGILYLVATPIGNLEDITLRALRILQEVDCIAAEDTRHTLQLLNHFHIAKPLISYYKQTEKQKGAVLLNKLQEGKNIALVSDAGTPAISDPGEEVVKLCIQNGIQVVPVPGACACITALIASGLSTKNFTFVGFLPVHSREKIAELEKLKYLTSTLVFYEAPHKILHTLQSMLDVFGDRPIVLCRELTKIHEQYIRGTISEVLTRLDNPRGEFVILIEGNQQLPPSSTTILSQLSLEEHYAYYEKQGLDKKEIIKQIAKDRHLPKNDIYQHFLQKK